MIVCITNSLILYSAHSIPNSKRILIPSNPIYHSGPNQGPSETPSCHRFPKDSITTRSCEVRLSAEAKERLSQKAQQRQRAFAEFCAYQPLHNTNLGIYNFKQYYNYVLCIKRS